MVAEKIDTSIEHQDSVTRSRVPVSTFTYVRYTTYFETGAYIRSMEFWME
jgi:hypothetical protein